MINTLPVWDELQDKILSKWPEIADGYEAVQASRLNWRDALAGGLISAPFVVIRPMPAQPYEELSITEHYSGIPVEITYVRNAKQTDTEKSTDVTVMQAIELKLYDLAHDLEHGTYQYFQVIDECSIDCSDVCEANQSFMATEAPYLAGTLSVTLVVSEPS